MILSYFPSPDYFICAKKHFKPMEEHVTRIYERSVLIIMTEGELHFREDGSEITLRKGEYYIQKQRLFQEGLPLTDPPIYIYIEFNGSFSEIGNGIPLRGKYDANRVLPLAERLCEAAKDKSRNLFYYASYMNRIFSELAGDTVSERNSVAHLIKSHIESEYASSVTLYELSKKFGYSEDYLNRLFKAEFGITPHKHLINTRLEHALWLLENTSISAERVANAVGYNDFSAFWRAFRSKYGISPAQSRK